MTTDAELDRLDRLCATEIMGFEYYEANGKHYPVYRIGDDVIMSVAMYFPTRDIRQAWDVLDKIGASISVYGSNTTQWHCMICLPMECDPEEFEDYVCEAETSQLAIVLAALKSKGIEAK